MRCKNCGFETLVVFEHGFLTYYVQHDGNLFMDIDWEYEESFTGTGVVEILCETCNAVWDTDMYIDWENNVLVDPDEEEEEG